MSRLIDADELIEKIEEYCDELYEMSVCDYLNLICKAPTVSTNGWFYPSKGEVPDKTDDYLVYLERDGVGNIIIATYYVGAEEWCFCGDEMLEPVAWMPLPEPPKEETDART